MISNLFKCRINIFRTGYICNFDNLENEIMKYYDFRFMLVVYNEKKL